MRPGVWLAVAFTALVSASAAVAAFPGKNGLITFQQSKIVLFKGASQDLFVMSPRGGKPRDITNTPHMNETSPSFSPDGRRIVFVWEKPGLAGSPKQPAGIGVINANGTGYRRLTTLDTLTMPYSPSFTPDGKRIVYARQLAAAAGVLPVVEVFWISATGGAEHQITSSGETVRGNVLVSPLGTELAFGSGPSDYSTPPELTVTDMNGGNPRSLGDAIQLSDWSPDGKRFAYSGPKLAVWVVPESGGAPVEIGDGPGRNADPVFSPDGRFVIWSNEFTHDLWIANSNGGGAHDLSHQLGFAKDPSWGPAPKR